MTPDKIFDARLAAKKLLREGRSGALATLMQDSGDTYCSPAKVATTVSGEPVLLDERREGDPLEVARVMLMGRCVKDDDAATRVAYLRRHPDAELYANFS